MVVFDEKKPRHIKTKVIEDQTLELVRGQRGKPLLSHQGFLYAQNNKTSESIYWWVKTVKKEERSFEEWLKKPADYP